ncbi:peptide chain release factor 2, partial [Armatimonas sp.]|uniref:peptide chain release factor 2 n=1 Tax=Armatimonas sp. TaxID=1872638 RepID=UPI00375363EE
MLADISKDLSLLAERLDDIGGIFDLPRRNKEIAQLEALAGEPALWDDVARAQKTMQALAKAKEEVLPYLDLRRKLDDTLVLIEMAESDEDPEAYESEVRSETAAITAGMDKVENATLLSGPYDAHDAILEIKPGAGGTEACDWAAMLLRMYLRWAEANGFQAEVNEELPGEVAGISSATVFVTGRNAYGMLRSEHGVHRLVRISPYNANGKRQTSFAAVEVLPQIEDDSELVIDDKDLRLDTFRASGAGGQHVNKTSSAVRITHIPTNIVVTCQDQRSQLQNKEVAMRVLRAKLAEVEARKFDQKMAELRGDQQRIEWGSQIRNYVFQPYTQVTDIRSRVKLTDVNAIMDGNLEALQLGYLRWFAGKGAAGDATDGNDED